MSILERLVDCSTRELTAHFAGRSPARARCEALYLKRLVFRRADGDDRSLGRVYLSPPARVLAEIIINDPRGAVYGLAPLATCWLNVATLLHSTTRNLTPAERIIVGRHADPNDIVTLAETVDGLTFGEVAAYPAAVLAGLLNASDAPHQMAA